MTEFNQRVAHMKSVTPVVEFGYDDTEICTETCETSCLEEVEMEIANRKSSDWKSISDFSRFLAKTPFLNRNESVSGSGSGLPLSRFHSFRSISSSVRLHRELKLEEGGSTVEEEEDAAAKEPKALSTRTLKLSSMVRDLGFGFLQIFPFFPFLFLFPVDEGDRVLGSFLKYFSGIRWS